MDTSSPDYIVGYLARYVQLLKWLTGSAPALVAGTYTSPRKLAQGGELEYAFKVEFPMRDARRVVLDVHLLGNGEAGRFWLNLVGQHGALQWAWHFDHYHPRLGGWGHEHRGTGRAQRTTAQDCESGLDRLREHL